MNKKGFGRIVIDLVVAFTLIIQTVVPVMGDEILLDNCSVTGGLITAGVASILIDEKETLDFDESGFVEDNILLQNDEENLESIDDVTIQEIEGLNVTTIEEVQLQELDSLGDFSGETEADEYDEEYYTDEIDLYNSSGNLATMTEKEYFDKVEAFQNDSRYKGGASWPDPGCARYTSAFAQEVCGIGVYSDGVPFFDINEVRNGDVIKFKTGSNSYHYFVVFRRHNDDYLWSAEGAYSNVVRIEIGYRLDVGNNKVIRLYNQKDEKSFSFEKGWHLVDLKDKCCEMDNGIDKVKEGEYVIVSAVSLDDNDKIKKNKPYVMDLDGSDVVVDRSLSDKTSVWDIEAIENRFYKIRNTNKDRVLSLDARDKEDKTNISVGRWYETDCESWWSFDEMWTGKYIIENRHSGMCATRSDGESVKQRDFYGKKDDRVDNQTWLLVRPDKPTIKTGSLPNGEVGKGYSVTLEGDCDEWIAIEWSLAGSSGALPNGLSLSKDGVLSGTPTETGTFNLKIIAENEFGYTTENYTLVIEGGVGVTGITLNKTSLELSKGSVAILTPTVSPENATDKSFTCKSSDENVVTVSSSGKTVSVTPVNEGTATITVTSNSNKDKSASCKVTVKPSITQVTSVSLNKSSLELVAGSSEILMATVLPGTATDRSVTWKSSDEKVATVSSSGKVTAIKEGNATITVTSNSSNDKSASCKITVKPAPTGVIIKADEVNGAAGKEVSVPVRISNNTGLGSMALTITSDSDLTLKNIEKGSLLSFGTFNTDTETGFVQWYTSSDKAVTGDGVLFTLKFNVKAGAEKKSHPVNISFKDNLRENVTDEKSNVLDVTLLPGNVNTTIVKGDVTGDGVVAMGDVVKVARAVAGNSTLTDDEKESADVTGDKVVAMGDVVKIARYVAGSVTEL